MGHAEGLCQQIDCGGVLPAGRRDRVLRQWCGGCGSRTQFVSHACAVETLLLRPGRWAVSLSVSEPPSRASVTDPVLRRPRGRSVGVGAVDGEEVAGCGVEGVADGGEGGEADGAASVVFEDGEIDEGDAGAAGEFGEGHAALFEDFVEAAGDAVGFGVVR